MEFSVTVRVRYFSVLRERAGCETEEIEAAKTTAREFAEWLLAERSLGVPSSMVRVAVNGAFVSDAHPLSSGDEVVLVPPVAGG